MQKTRKLISMLLAVLMVLSMCTVGMMSVSALPEGAVINDVEGNDASGIDGEIFGLMGDADLNDKINVRDATEIQKSAAKLVTLSETAAALADVDLNDKVNVKDATAIQKWIAKIPVDMPINCLVYIPAEETTVTTVPTEPSTGDEPTTAASVDETEPTASVPVIVIPPVVTDPTDATTATDATEPTAEASTAATTAATQPTTEATTAATEPTVTQATDPVDDTVTIYFQNNWMWSDVSVHMWTADGDVTTWPGNAMTFVENDGNYDIYSVVVPDGVVGLLFNGIKDDGTGTLDQTPDILEWYDGQCFYNVWDASLNEGAGGNSVDSFQYILPTEATTAATTTATQATSAATQATTAATQPTSAETEPTTEADDGMITIYFTNSDGWEGVYIYGFYGEVGVEATGKPLGAYPGVAMTFVRQNQYQQDIYSYDIPADIDYIKFSDGTTANNRTDNIPNEILADNVGFYTTEKGTKYWGYETYEYVPETENTTASAEATTASAEVTTASTDPAETTAALVESNVKLMGSFNNWSGQAMYVVDDTNVTLTITLAAGTYEFKVLDGDTWLGNDGTIDDTTTTTSDTGWTMKDAGNCTLNATGGTYTFNFDTTTKKLIILYNVEPETDPTEATTEATTVATQPTTAATQPTTEATTAATTAATQPTTEGPVVAPEAPAPAAVAIEGSYGGTGTEDDPFLVAPSVKMTMIITGELGDADGLGYNVNYYRSFVEWEVGQTSVSYNGVKAPALDATQAVNVYLIAYNVAENGDHLQSATYTTTTIWVKGAEEPATQATTQATTAATEPTTQATTAATDPTESEPVLTESKYSVRGSFNEWGEQVMYLNDDSSASATITLAAGTYEFKIYDGTSWYGNGGSFEDNCTNWGFRSAVESNCTLIASGGTYTFTVTEASESIRVTVTKETVVDPTEATTEATTAATEPTTETTTAATEPTSEATTAATEPTTPEVETVTITFNGAKTTWINDASAYFVLVDRDTNTEYEMTKGSNYTWTVEVPVTVVNIKFNRCDPNSTTVWNAWTAGDRGEAVQYNTTGSGTGAWAGDTTVKYYVMGSFNNWSTGDAMTANADGSYTQEIELAAGSYEYKIATADWSVEYPSGYQNNAKITVTTAGTYVFTLSASGEISAVAK